MPFDPIVGHLLHNHAGAVLACDFFVVVTATFRRLYVFVLLDIGTLRIVNWNLTAHPTAEWDHTAVSKRSASGWRLPLSRHDRDRIFAPAVDDALRSMSLQVLKTPVRASSERAL